MITPSCSTYLSATQLQYSHRVNRMPDPLNWWCRSFTGCPHSTQIIPLPRTKVFVEIYGFRFVSSKVLFRA